MVTDLKTTSASRPAGARMWGCAGASKRQFMWAIIFAISLAVGTAVLRHVPLPPIVRYLIPIVPLAFGFFYIYTMVSDIRGQMDELQLRIYLEAAAVVVCGLFVIVLVYPLLQAANLVGPLDYMVILVLIVGLGTAGYMVASRRYR